MINCYKCESLLSSFLEQDISNDDRKSVQTHVDSCPRCEQKLAHLKVLKGSLTALPRYKTSENFSAVLRARIRQEERRKRSWMPALNFSWQVPAMAAVTVCVVIVGLMAFRNQSILPNQQQSIAQVETTQTAQQSTQPIQVTRYVNVAEHFSNSSATSAELKSNSQKKSSVDSLRKQQRVNDLKPLINRASTTVKF